MKNVSRPRKTSQPGQNYGDRCASFKEKKRKPGSGSRVFAMSTVLLASRTRSEDSQTSTILTLEVKDWRKDHGSFLASFDNSLTWPIRNVDRSSGTRFRSSRWATWVGGLLDGGLCSAGPRSRSNGLHLCISASLWRHRLGSCDLHDDVTVTSATFHVLLLFFCLCEWFSTWTYSAADLRGGASYWPRNFLQQVRVSCSTDCMRIASCVHLR